MLFAPIGENAPLQQRAWVTYSLLALNVAMFLIIGTGASDRDRMALLHSWRTTIEYVRDRPYLRVPVDAKDLMPRALRDRQPVPDATIPDWKVAIDQKDLDTMTTELRDRYDASRDTQLAFVPAIASVPTIFTSMFLHAGLLHLIGNMLFLIATAPFVEDAFGRVLFTLLYLSGGAVATLAFAARYPDSIIPLVGASGAIAAVMGAFLVRFVTARITFIVLPLPFIRFSIPALVVLPLWFLEQIVSIPMEDGAGVAVTAHVTGFAYGIAFAAVTMVAQTTLRRRERPETKESNTAHSLRTALDVARARHDVSAIDDAAARLLPQLAVTNHASAVALVRELSATPDLLPQFLARGAAFAERCGDRDLAITLYGRLAEMNADSPNAVPSLVKLANAQRSLGDLFNARLTLEQARDHPACSPEWRRRIDNTLALLSAPPAPDVR